MTEIDPLTYAGARRYAGAVRASAIAAVTLALLACARPPESSPGAPPARAGVARATPASAPDAAPARHVDGDAEVDERRPFAAAPFGDAGDAAPAEAGPAEPSVATKPSRLATPPGPCVDPTRDARARVGLPSLDDDFFQRRVGLDLDGDGLGDWFVSAGADAIDYYELAYLRRGACGHFVGKLPGGAQQAPKGALHAGLLDLETASRCRRECCDETTWTSWAFDGGAYRAQGTRREIDDCSAGGAFE